MKYKETIKNYVLKILQKYRMKKLKLENLVLMSEFNTKEKLDQS